MRSTTALSLSSSLLLLASTLTSAFTITYPVDGTVFDTTVDTNVTWDTASDDPSLVNILLNQQLGGSESIASNVDSKAGFYTVPANKIKINAGGYYLTVNSVASEGNAYVAKSGVFDLSSASSIASSTLASSTVIGVNGTAKSTATSAGATYTGSGGASPSASVTAPVSTISGMGSSSSVAAANAGAVVGFGAVIAGFAAVLL